jgi:hypothetical protein
MKNPILKDREYETNLIKAPGPTSKLDSLMKIVKKSVSLILFGGVIGAATGAGLSFAIPTLSSHIPLEGLAVIGGAAGSAIGYMYATMVTFIDAIIDRKIIGLDKITIESQYSLATNSLFMPIEGEVNMPLVS